MTKVVGLTGGIASGKTTLARYAEALGIPVFYADEVVEGLYKTPEVLAELAKAFPSAGFAENANGLLIGRKVAQDEAALIALEQIMHPLVGQKAEEFIACQVGKNAPLAILEVPLLYQSGMDKICNYVIATDLPLARQKERALRRSGMTEEKFAFLSRRQKIDFKTKADFIIDTSCSIKETEQAFKKITEMIKGDANGSKNP